MKHLIILGCRGWLAGVAILIALRGASAVSSEGIPRPLELQRAIMGNVGRHLEALRVEMEKIVCTGDANGPKRILDRLTTGVGVPVAAAALYSPSGDELFRKGFPAGAPWSEEAFFRAPGSPWLEGRSIAISLSGEREHGPASADIRLPLQCDGAAGYETRAWVVVRLDLRRLLDRLGPELGLGEGESVWMAANPEHPLFLRGPAAGLETRLSGLTRQQGPKGAAFWARMRSLPSGKLKCDGFDPDAFVFRRTLAEWVSLTLGASRVLLVREMPAEAYSAAADSRAGMWSDEAGCRLALLIDGSYCHVYLRREAETGFVHASGRLLDETLSARSEDGLTTFQVEFKKDGSLSLSVYTDHAERGVTREAFTLVKEKPVAGALPGLRP